MNTNATWLAAEQALQRKDLAAAERLFRQALSTDSAHAPSLIGLSTVLTQRGSHREAYAATIAAFENRPPIAPVLYAIAQRLRYFHEFARLVECLGHPAFAQTAPSPILAKAAVMLSSIGAHEPATALVDASLKRDPRESTSLHVRGNFHLFRGETEQAEACYEASLRSDPALFQNSLVLAQARAQTPEHNHVARLHEQLKRAKPGGTGEVYLHYAMHKELHDLQRYDEAWTALQRGCEAKRRHVKYALERDERLVEALESVCDGAFAGHASSVNQEIVPIFIVGMHRSGTTLLERMLSGHSLIGDAGETSAFHAQMELAIDCSAPEGPNAEFVRRAPDVDYDAVARGYADAARWLSRGKPYFTEKLPQNFFNVGFIARALPQAKFLHLVRDPMDTCFSNLRQLFSGAALYSYDQRELGGFYLLYRRMMAHWHKILPGRVLDIGYDDLVSDPLSMAQRVAAHCGLAFEESMVDIGRASGTVATPSAMTARQGFQRNRGQVWRHYEPHLQVLQRTLQPLYEGPGRPASANRE